ncbi:MAG TPA: type II secretion system protein [Gemmataceae bacterium]|jgi:prepilin-type N-terminal cleavage/methylation domain-containing protein
MMRIHSASSKRPAFTLVELMVVLLILVTMVSLIGSAVVKSMDKLTEMQTRKEISEMEVAFRAFMADYGLTEPPPTYLLLSEADPINKNKTGQTDGLTAAFLEKLFGHNLGPTDWNGDGKIIGGTFLKGSQCLVFYLGGIPNSAAVLGGAAPAPQGFSTNNMKPSYGSMPGETMGKRKGPYFNFAATRLYLPRQQVLPPGDGFFWYLDPWMTKSGNLYLTMGGSPYIYYSYAGINGQWPITADSGANPYKTADGQYTNPNTFQIISAGKDGWFGLGLWNPLSGATGTGADDQANFSATLLGAGQN